MAEVPTTSTTLLRDIAQDSQHARWAEFVARYRPMMEAYMHERFPSLDADDVIQETLVAVCRVMPSYRYDPDAKGHFHNYLTGILRNKALRQSECDNRRQAKMRKLASGKKIETDVNPPSDRYASQRDIFEIALRQLLADDSVHARTREVFRRVAVNGDSPEDVASDFGITRNSVDQMKSRMMTRLREFVSALEKVEARLNAQ